MLWGAAEGRLVLRETRRITVAAGAEETVIDLESEMAPNSFPVEFAPTRRAYFDVRVAETLLPGLVVTDDRGAASARLPWIEGATKLDLSGPVGGGAVAGIAVVAAAPAALWFVTDWGVATVRHWRAQGARLRPGQTMAQRCRFVVHDGAADPGMLAEWQREAMPPR